MTVWKFLAAEAGEHVHATVYVSENVRGTFANCGNLTMRKTEFEHLRRGLGFARVVLVEWVTPESERAKKGSG